MKTKANFKELLEIAVSELKDLTQVENPDFRLEQVEYLGANDEWNIVVSFLVENHNTTFSPISIAPLQKYQRVYKRLKINSEREVAGMYIFDN